MKAIVLKQWRSMAVKQAQDAGLEPAGVDWLLREVAHLDRLAWHLADPQADVPIACAWEWLQALWQTHCTQHTPLQYLVGWAPWRNLHLQVAPGVLIPRPETAVIVDIALAALQQEPRLALGEWADLGTGSGAIALALVLESETLRLHGVDCSPIALDIAQANAAAYGLKASPRLHWHQGSWFEPLASPCSEAKLSAMLSNPPYIPTAEVAALAPSVRHHEPSLALDGGEDGLAALSHLIQTAPAYLCSQGLWLVEVMAGQAAIVAAQLQQNGQYDRIAIYQDDEGVDRFVSARIQAID